MKSSSLRHALRPLVGLILIAASLRAQTPPPETPPVALPKIVEEIGAGNPELKFYESEIALAKARTRGASAFNDPELSLDVGRKRVRDMTGTLAGSGTAWSVSVTQTFEWPGRIALRKAIANRQVELAELGLARFQNALTGRAWVLAYTLHAANAKASAVREVADRFSALKETFLARDPAGMTPLLETRVIEAGELALQRRATTAELEVQAALIELNQLRGAPVSAPLRVATPTLKLNDAPAFDALLSA
ncbi:MAG: TolC family protein, partial [Opitutaceae bacterium]